MTSDQIKDTPHWVNADPTMTTFWLKEIAFQLALTNELYRRKHALYPPRPPVNEKDHQ